MFHDRKHMPVEQSLRGGTTEARCLTGLLRIGAVAYDIMGTRQGYVQDRQAIDIDPDATEVMCDESGRQAGQLRLSLERNFSPTETRRGWIGAPMGWPKPLDPSALLIDQHRGMIATEAVSKRFDERSDLVRLIDITFEENEPKRLCFSEKATFRGGQFEP
jgi:hypothetical protein